MIYLPTLNMERCFIEDVDHGYCEHLSSFSLLSYHKIYFHITYNSW